MQPSGPEPDISSPDLRDRVLAVLVVHGEQPWHDVVAERLAGRRRGPESPRLLVVDNGGAPAAARIAEAGGADLMVIRRARGFGEAVAAAVGHPLGRDAEFLLLLHDDLILDDDAVRRMVAVMDSRREVAVTGPKLLDWQREPALQQVGMTIDAMGRAESHLAVGEVDQGQHDHRDRTLYVSTAGMLVRRSVFVRLGGFDPRFTAMRDDLDLCWRAWLAGWTVEVVPEAVGWHVAAASRSVRRRGRPRRAATRYLAERHTLAAMIKNLGAWRLAWTLPIHMLLAFGKAFGFLLTRRPASAAVPFLAAAWNVKTLPGTLRLRRAVQSGRQRGDTEVADLFATGSWRTRAYVEAVLDWLGGTQSRSLVGDDAAGDESARAGATGALRRHPALFTGVLLGLVWLAACIPLLGSGQLLGGQVLAWPEQARTFLAAYVSGWGTGPMASEAFPAPIQLLLWALSAAVGGGAWIAQRVVVLGLVPAIWLVSLRAGRLLTARPGPRVVGATLYACSPVVLGAFGHGRLDALVVALALPAGLLLVASVSQPAIRPGRAWRAVALLAVLLAVTIGAAPRAWPVVVLPLLGVAAVATHQRSGPSLVGVRLAVVGLGAGGLLLPWLVDLHGTVRPELDDPIRLRMWEALSGRVDLLPALGGVAGWLWVATAAGIVLGALAVGLRRRSGTVFALLGGMVAFAAAAAVVSRQTDPYVWPPIVALPAALALAALGATVSWTVPGAVRRRRPALARPVVAALVTLIVLGPLAVAGTAVTVGAWPELRRSPARVPLFVDADADRVGPYRILLLEGDSTRLRWDVTEPGGPTMTSYGTRPDPTMHVALERVVTGLVSGDPRAAGRAGVLNVRYLVLRDASTRAAVEPALAEFPGVEQMAAGGGGVYQLRTWLPRAAVVDRAWLSTALAGDPLPTAAVERSALAPLDVGRYGGGPVDGELLLVSESWDASWVGDAGGRPLDPMGFPGRGVPVMSFDLEGPSERVVADAAPAARAGWVAWQAAVLLGLLSLALRAPGRAAGAPARPGVLPDTARSTRSDPVPSEAAP